MTTAVAILAALVLVGVAVRTLRAALPVLAVLVLVGLAVTGAGGAGALNALAGPLLLLLIVGAGFFVMLRGFFR